jgi:4-amino-4-deoxy-L-arabinose transferase-like glycosyltransferase
MVGMARRPVLTLILLSSLTFFLGLGRQAITDMDEAYYAEAAREMVVSGDWLTPHFNYANRFEKPILYYWLTAGLYTVTGPTEAAARFWSALAGVGLMLLTWGIARDAGATTRAAWLAGAVTATCFGYFAEARLALPDLPLTFCITLTIWSALRVTVRGPGGEDSTRGSTARSIRAWVLTGAGAGLGFLMKGPVALVVPTIVLLPIWWRERASVRIVWRGVLVAALIFAVIGLPWYVAMTVTHGREYLHSFFIGDNLQRFATNRFTGRTSAGWWFYGPILLGGLVPWTPYALTLLVARLFGRGESGRRWTLSTTEWRLLLWAVVPLLFFSISLGKQPRYILPVLPPVAILVGMSLSSRLEAGTAKHRAISIATILTAALFVITGVLLMRARPLFINSYAVATSFGIAAMFGWAAAMVVMTLRAQWHRLPVMMALASASLLLTLQFGALAGVRPEPVERMARLIRAYRTNEPVGEKDVFGRNMVFYAGFKQQKIDDSNAARFLQSPDRVFLVVRERDAAVLRTKGVTARELGRVDYLDTGNVKLRTLLWPQPAHDIDTILLVTNK